MLEKEFTPPEQALSLKELGFDEPCFGYYDGNHNLQYMYNGKPEKFTEKRMGVSDSKWVGWISAPTYSQAFNWFRDKHKLHSTITSISQESWQWHIQEPSQKLGELYDEDYETYEEAELECLKKLIEIVKNK